MNTHIKTKTDKLINEENGEALVLHNHINRLERRLGRLINEINTKKAELKQICIHDETIKKEEYIEGGYLDRSEYIIITVCKICHKELNKQVEYGGFG
jgi:peptide subunit release factor 1 (eRF1)